MHHTQKHTLTDAGRHLLDRRGFFAQTGTSLSAIALAQMLSEQGLLADGTVDAVTFDPTQPHAPRHGHGTAKARNVLVIFCAGACSQLETWDYKPELIKQDGKPMPGGPTVTFQGPAGNLARRGPGLRRSLLNNRYRTERGRPQSIDSKIAEAYDRYM